MDTHMMETYLAILREELVPAMGCTEPIAVAYAAALARKTLGVLPEGVDIRVSANIIKNVKSVVVPHTGGLRGIAAAAAAGAAAVHGAEPGAGQPLWRLAAAQHAVSRGHPAENLPHDRKKLGARG